MINTNTNTNTNTNIKNLPAGSYWTSYGYSDAHAWIEIKRTAKTATLRPVLVTADPEWKEKMQAHVGGFFAHVGNQNEQTWIFDSIGARDVVIRETKRGWRSKHGDKFHSDRARHFHDYNF